MSDFKFLDFGDSRKQESDDAFAVDFLELENSEVIFVSDFFANQMVGGAEKTLQALIDFCPFKYTKINSHMLTMDIMQKNMRKFWIFGNISNMNPDLIVSALTNLKYSYVVFDFAYCKYRSPEKHKFAEKKDCDCCEQINGKLIFAFMLNAESIWFMAEKQAERYFEFFPALRNVPHTVLSSVFDDLFFRKIIELRSKAEDKNNKYLIFGSNSWIKGAKESEEKAKELELEYEVVNDLPYDKFLEKLARSKGIVFLPNGGDTCPRLVIEAKLLNCDLIINENVLHKDEEWFATNNLRDTLSYLYKCRDIFWNGVSADMNYEPSISGYTTTYNCESKDYPFIESIDSVLSFCDEVVVVDAGSDDNTWDILNEKYSNDDRVALFRKIIDFDNPRWAVEIDGHLKAYARSLCEKEFCFQFDVDEVVHEQDYDKYRYFVKHFPRQVDLVCCPVIEYWGSGKKVRADMHNWKWRVSRNRPNITHGVPVDFREYDENGNAYPKPITSDSCDYIFLGNYKPVPFLNFYDQSAENLRRNNLEEYEKWYNLIVNNYPSVHHYSWFNIKKKIIDHKNHWFKFHASMYSQDVDDTSENNKFFDKPWSEVTDREITKRAKELEKIGPRIVHHKIDSSIKGNTINVKREHPRIMKKWIERNKS